MVSRPPSFKLHDLGFGGVYTVRTVRPPQKICAAMVGPQVGLLFATGTSLEQVNTYIYIYTYKYICIIPQNHLGIQHVQPVGSHHIPLFISKVVLDSWSTPQLGFWWLQYSCPVHHVQANTSFMMGHCQSVCNRGAWMFLGPCKGLGDRPI